MKNARYWWKEEDLQSYLYHLLLKRLPDAIEIIHREYPLIIREKPRRKWAGVVDVAILEPLESDFNFFGPSHMIRDAIELKFLRNYRTGFSSGSYKEFINGFKRDRKKLMKEGIKNFRRNSHKHLLFFRKIDKSKISSSFDSVRNFMKKEEEKNIKGLQFSYIEVYMDEDEQPPTLLHNWDGRVVEEALPV
ncbi:hypothetical protein ES703_20077 [subsurface metagenome]